MRQLSLTEQSEAVPIPPRRPQRVLVQREGPVVDLIDEDGFPLFTFQLETHHELEH